MKGWTAKDVERITGKKALPKSANQKNMERIGKEILERNWTNDCLAAGLPAPISEYKFHPDRNWKIDYLFVRGSIKVALEVEGGAVEGKNRGRHLRAKGYLKDMEKYNAISAAGIILVRCVPNEKRTTGIQAVKAVFDNLSQGA